MFKFFAGILVLILLYLSMANTENFTDLCLIDSNGEITHVNNYEHFGNTNNNINYMVIHIRSYKNRYYNIVENQLKLGKKINIFDAIKGSDIDIHNLDKYDPKIVNTFNYKYINEVGCYLSHLMLIKDAINSPYEYTVIFEDDFIIEPSFSEDINRIINTIGDFDVINLGNGNKNHGVMYKDDIYTVDRTNHLWGTYGYIIKNKHAQKIYNNLLDMSDPIDEKLKILYDSKKLNGYVLYPSIVKHMEGNNSSTIRIKESDPNEINTSTILA